MNRFMLLRQFQAQIGISPHEYQRICRIGLVKKHLRDGMPLAELASACGYYDQSHMIREFKRRTGLTPKAFIPKSPSEINILR
jgi:AraC-like DNA-binding protein